MTRAMMLCAMIALASAAMAEDEWTAPPRASRNKNPIPATPESVAKGKALFAANCMSCHGPEGKGDGPAAKDLQKKPGNLSDPKMRKQTDGALFWKVTEGKAPMPTFEKLITEEDRWHIVNYVRTLVPDDGGGKK